MKLLNSILICQNVVINMLKYLLVFLPFLVIGQNATERTFSLEEKRVLKKVYDHAFTYGWYIGNMGVFRVKEQALYNGDVLWKIDMIYDESELKTGSLKQWSYLGEIPILLFSDASGEAEGGVPADILKRVIADRLYALPDTGPAPVSADEDGFRSAATASGGPPPPRPSHVQPFSVSARPLAVIFNEKGEIVYSNFMPKPAE